MHRTDHLVKLAAITLCATLALLSSGCAVSPPAAEPVREPEPVVTRAPAAVRQPPTESPKPVSSRVAIVLSDGKPAYQSVATELARLLPDHAVFNLADEGLSAQLAMSIIAETPTDVVVAIGLRAAIAAKADSKVPVVFCQVFNFSDHDLIADRFKGVASLPPLDLQIQAWKQLDPRLKNVGAILGDGHESLIAEATLATERHDVKLHYRTARSDRETLYQFNQLLPHIDGFWLFPDNRVLSLSVLREMLDYASRHNIEVAVFNDSLLDLGATISSPAIAADIASQIAAVVKMFSDGAGASIPDVTPLTRIDLHINEAALRALGVTTANSQTIAGAEDAK